MNISQPANSGPIQLAPVTRENWRAVAQLRVAPAQADFVAEPAYYLALCHYEALWQPLAIVRGGEVIGFMMWAIDPADGSCWLGGIIIGHQHQGRGYGRQATRAALAMLGAAHGYTNFALSYNPANAVARRLYQSLGFAETGEREDDELVARLVVPA